MLLAADFSDPDFLGKVVVPIGTFVLGFFVSRWTMSLKEKKDYQLALQKNADTYQASIATAFEQFTKALSQYAKEKKPSLDDFFQISSTGEAYFTQLRMVCNATQSGTISAAVARTTFSPLIKEAWERSIPRFYEVLGEIASKNDIEWKGELRRENYQPVVDFYETHCMK